MNPNINLAGEREPDGDAMSPQSQPETGWDPYEVWRTRVLIPRLEGTPALVAVKRGSRVPEAEDPGD